MRSSGMRESSSGGTTPHLRSDNKVTPIANNLVSFLAASCLKHDGQYTAWPSSKRYRRRSLSRSCQNYGIAMIYSVSRTLRLVSNNFPRQRLLYLQVPCPHQLSSRYSKRAMECCKAMGVTTSTASRSHCQIAECSTQGTSAKNIDRHTKCWKVHHSVQFQ